MIILFYSYVTIKPFFSTKSILLAKKLWILGWGLMLIWSIIILPWFEIISSPNIFLLLAIVPTTYIAFKIPEALLISHVQVVRATGLYNKVKSIENPEETSKFGSTSIIKYLQSIPDNLMSQK